MGQLDWMKDRLETGLGKVEGTGWAIGPYLTLQFLDGLQFDARALWGQSRNSANQSLLGNKYSGKFDSDRWLVEGRLSGKTEIDKFTIEPSTRLFYMKENWGKYSVSDGNRKVKVPGGKASIGTLSAKLELSYFQQHENYAIQPTASAELTWIFDDPGIYNTLGTLQQNKHLSTTLSAGLEVYNQHTVLRLEGTYGGLGSKGFDSVGGKVSVSHGF